MSIGVKTSDRDLEYYRVCGTPKEKALAKAERERRIGDIEGGESMTKKKAKVEEAEVQPVTKKRKKDGVGEVFKVWSKGDVGIPHRVASKCGIASGMQFTCAPTDNVGEILVKVVDVGGEKA